MGDNPEATVYITGDVALPEAILDAQLSGRLLFFVGAGVSVANPSNLPLFDGLARQLADLAKAPHPADGEALDLFLGSLPDKFDTHLHARSLIARDDSTPNQTHDALVRLADAMGPFRIVTTNFDDHLASAAAAGGIPIAEKWIGPALPLGDDFIGLVHLHGSVLREPHELVLTDRDFGRAYLTYSWATRFLVPMFQQFTVIFVGYSHDDPLMQYLALGLPSLTPRYAFTSADNASDIKWERLGVKAIGYPVEGHDHAALVAALGAWDARARMGKLDHQARMQEIVEAGSALIPVDRDYLLERLRVIEGVQEFAGATASIGPERQVAWLSWMEGLPEFKALFAGGNESSASHSLENWFCNTFIESPELHGAALQTAQRLGQRFSDGLFRSASWAAEGLANSDPDAGRRWKTFLATSIQGQSAPFPGEVLLPYVPGEAAEPISVLRASLRPFLALRRRGFIAEAEQPTTVPDAEANWNTDERTLGQHLARLIESATPGDPRLGVVLEESLNAAYDLLEAYHGERRWDPLAFGRSAIEPHEQDRLRHSVDAVIDGLRDFGEKALLHQKDLPDRWWSFNRVLFQRLAVHLLRLDPSRSADQKVSWLLDRSLLYESKLKHEVYGTLAEALADCSPEVRGRLLATTQQGPCDQDDEPDGDRRTSYAIYNLLVWLTGNAPKWAEAAAALDAAREAHPDFAPREHPDFNSWMTSGSWTRRLPMAPEEFVASFSGDPAGALDGLLAHDYAEHGFEEPEWSDALSLVSKVAESRPDLGVSLWDLIESRNELGDRTRDLFVAITEGWAVPDLGAVIDEAVARVATQVATTGSAPSVGRFLLEQIRRLIDGDESPAVASMRHMALQLWREQGALFRHDTNLDPVSFVPLYLNSWPGDLALYWVREIERRWRKHRDHWSGLNDEERSALTELLDGPPHAFDATAPALASQLFFIFAADPDFSTEHLLPLFTADTTSTLAWKPFLHNPRYNDKLLAAGFLEGVLTEWDRLEELGEDDLQAQFFGLVASIVSFAGIAPEQRQALLDRAVVVDDGAHAAKFAEAVVHLLRDDGVDGAEVWNHWLCEHLEARLRGHPRTADQEELARWSDIVPYLGDAIPESVAMLADNTSGFGDRYFDSDFPDGALAKYGPALVAHFTDRVRHSDSGDRMVSYQVRKLIETMRSQLDEVIVRPLEDAAKEQGFLPDGLNPR